MARSSGLKPRALAQSRWDRRPADSSITSASEIGRAHFAHCTCMDNPVPGTIPRFRRVVDDPLETSRSTAVEGPYRTTAIPIWHRQPDPAKLGEGNASAAKAVVWEEEHEIVVVCDFGGLRYLDSFPTRSPHHGRAAGSRD